MAPRLRKADQLDAPPIIFISATSKDLGTMRETIKQALLTMGCMPIEQSNFPPDYRSVHEMIEDKIARCEAVIHIVGLRYGAEPDPSTLPEGVVRLSYTQMEADIARQLEKELYVFVCTEDFPYDDAPPESEELQELQRAYRSEISKSKKIYTKVVDQEELARKVRELEVEKLKGRIGANRRRVMMLLAALLLVLGGIGAGIWWWVPRVIKHEHQAGYDRGKAREQLIADIKNQAQKRTAAAGDDWRKVIEIEKWRDQQLNDLDRFLDRINQTFESGEASESYRRATDLLANKGTDEALAYLEAASGQRKSLIEIQVSRRDLEEAELRKLLQEELLAASLLERQFQFDAAEAKYRQILEKSGLWAKPRNDFAWFLIQRGKVINPALGNKKLREAQELCRGTLGITLRDRAPQDWATTQNNLGIVLEELGTRSSGEQSAQYLQQSVTAYRAALEVRTREQLPQDWATTQNNLGNVLEELGTRSSGEQSAQYLQQSITAYRAALEVRTREQLPQDWAVTQNNLGNVLEKLGTRSSGEQSAQYLEQSVTAYHAALEVRTREQLPQDWATTQNNLGNVLEELGRRSSGEQSAQYLQQSVTAYHAALEVRTREQLPQDWAATQNNLGNVLEDLGTRSSGEQGTQYLEQSVAAYRAALEVRTREQLPQDWATTQNNLGNVLEELGTRSRGEHSVGYLQQSVAAYENALTIFTPEANPYYNEIARRNLEQAKTALRTFSSR
jgi:tetratricopeptide (TPR) repeat protein